MKDESLLQLGKKFGKCGSWALWDEDGKIEPFIQKRNFTSLIRPTIIFMGLNASRDLKEEVDWANYHSDLKYKKGRSWKKSSCRRLAEIIQKEFPQFCGAYMTDIIKTEYHSTSDKLKKFLKNNPDVSDKNKKLLEEEMNLLGKVLESDKLAVICMGNLSFDITNKMGTVGKNKIYQIPHYAMHGSDKEVREKIRSGLKTLIETVN
ncbi:MAG: hypothetical protein D4Q79_02200 [Spirochaetia bacterium]|nr:MAG: hypothetical protein D4Q79_02200 [Spirochaetia bacterium]